MPTYTYTNDVYKSTDVIQWGKKSFKQMALNQLNICMEKVEPQLILVLYTKLPYKKLIQDRL